MEQRRINMSGLALLLVLSLIVIGVAPIQVSAQDRDYKTEIQTILVDYSDVLANSLSIGAASPVPNTTLSDTIIKFLSDRGNFYRMYFENGLMLRLLTINSEFQFETLQIEEVGSSIYIHTKETITLTGETVTQSAEEYPPVKAYSWAIQNAPSQEVANILVVRKEILSKAANESIDKGVSIQIVLKHDMEFSNNGQSLTLIRDSFTDSAGQLPGIDNVTWGASGFQRQRLDFNSVPEAILYDTPIEDMGEDILSAFSEPRAASMDSQDYYHEWGKWYADHYTSNASDICGYTDDGKPVYQDTDWWNPNETWFSCADCQSYVSQALNAGGAPEDDIWNRYSTTWTYVPHFRDYMESYGHGIHVSQLSSLIPGDVALVQDNQGYFQHAVMVATASPYGFDAHTNDRLLAPWQSAINYYMLVLTYW